MRILLASTLALGLALPGDTRTPPPTQVHVAVSVTDARGRVVPGLQAADFAVTERGARVPVVPVVDVRFVPPPAVAATAPPGNPAANEPASDSPPAGARVVAIFLDEYHVAPARSAAIRDLLTRLVREQLTDRDRVLVVKPLDPLLDLSLRGTPSEALTAIASFEGRQGDYTARTAFERELIAGEPGRIDRARSRIAVSALQAIVSRLAQAGIERKAFVVASEGMGPPPSSSPTVPTPTPTRSGDFLPTVDAIVRVATRGNVAISTLAEIDANPTGGAGAAGLLAEAVRQTDGHRVSVADADGLQTVVRDLDSYYLVALDGAGDGQFHPLEVRVTRPNVRVRVRPGYWAISPDELARRERAATPEVKPPVLPPLRTSRLIVPWVGQERAADGATRLTLVWEPAPTRAGDRTRTAPPSHLVVKALLPDGTEVFDGMLQSVTSGLGSQSVASFTVPSTLPTGRVRLQMSIEDASARVLDTDVRDVVVSAWKNAVAFGTPRVYRTRTAREFQGVEHDPEAVPSASRSFSRVERLLVRVPVYTAGAAAAAPPTVTATLLNRTGQVMRTLTVTATVAPGPFEVDVPLAGLAAGEYAVQWRAIRGADDVLETVPFRVTP